MVVGSDLGVECTLLGRQVLGNELENGRSGVSMAKELPVLSAPFEQFREVWMRIEVVLGKGYGVLLSREVPVELQSKDVTVS